MSLSLATPPPNVRTVGWPYHFAPQAAESMEGGEKASCGSPHLACSAVCVCG